ncbi:hypothetical protein M378DRAFT_169650 [Amanita muscaria Koide BX008]|uniref:Uncharacterized protein n=1 Tax=Amanita muscaria (strain Koide BX008) TaxID=946122 RepID=A0A0C2WQZ0_AMAMK|nr:hypothetical protein M378DRAFT_169650 [Amanita muscaria Koide BX008]
MWSKASYQKDAAAKEPLFGFLPRKVQGEQVRKAMAHELNPFTKQPYTQQYRKILEARKKLPVFAQMDDFYKMVCGANASIGEGSWADPPRRR